MTEKRLGEPVLGCKLHVSKFAHLHVHLVYRCFPCWSEEPLAAFGVEIEHPYLFSVLRDELLVVARAATTTALYGIRYSQYVTPLPLVSPPIITRRYEPSTW